MLYIKLGKLFFQENAQTVLLMWEHLKTSLITTSSHL